MKALVPATCDRCGKKIYPVNINGMPSGITAELADGKKTHPVPGLHHPVRIHQG